MGSFTVGCLIKNHVDREKTVRIPRLMVDTGSEATWIPRKFLEGIDVKGERLIAFKSHPAAGVLGDAWDAEIQRLSAESRYEFRAALGGRARTPCAPRRAAECPPYHASHLSATHYEAPEDIMMAN